MNYIIDSQLQLALDFIESTGRNLFLTGKAGTGKTTFLHNLKKSSAKRMIVVAPTGVAAINAAGVTIHSFFQLPFGPQIPNANPQQFQSNTESNSNSRIQRFSKEKISIIRSLDLLVIDEISMVRADMLDGIDNVLRRFRTRNKPFGGVQLLMIGDMQQLAPIAKDDEWAILKNYYETVYFFSSKALQQSNYISIELKQIFRQSDEQFIDLLNKVRNNNLDSHAIDLLNSRFIPNFKPKDDEGYITLTTHNYQAQNINNEKLKELKTTPETFTASIVGDFPEHIYPTDFKLTLKEGAQVMFVKNDLSQEKRFFNGKIGTVISIDEDIIYVDCPNDNEPIAVTPLEWDNTKYSINPDTKDIVETVTGSFIQYPLKLAWAITIHKSQGLTFEKAIIDAQSAFAHGQVYVALSRCRTLEGLVLSTMIKSEAIINDQTVDGFSKQIEKNQPTVNLLEQSKIDYQKQLVAELFDFTNIQKLISQIIRFAKENSSSFLPTLVESISSIDSIFNSEIIEIAHKFQQQVERIVKETNAVEKSPALQERLTKAIAYFLPKFESKFLPNILEINTETDSKELKTKINENIEKIIKEIEEKIMCLDGCKEEFSCKSYIEIRAKASVDVTMKKTWQKKSTKEETTNAKYPVLFNRIKKWRDSIAKEKNSKVYGIIRLNTIIEIVNELPYSKSQLQAIKGLGKKKIAEYGSQILKMVIDFRQEIGISIPEGDIFHDINETPSPKLKSHQISLQLFQSGKTIEQIAKERNMSQLTIAGHLSKCIEDKELNVELLVGEDKIETISKYFKTATDFRLTPAKEQLGDNFTFNDIKWVLSHLVANREITMDANPETNS
jgi:hypothetical protein